MPIKSEVFFPLGFLVAHIQICFFPATSIYCAQVAEKNVKNMLSSAASVKMGEIGYYVMI